MTTTTLPPMAISADIDLKIGMRDVIDMIVEERRAQLEDLRKDTALQRTIAKQRVEKSVLNMREAALAAAKTVMRQYQKLCPADRYHPTVTTIGDMRYGARSDARERMQDASKAKAYAAAVDDLSSWLDQVPHGVCVDPGQFQHGTTKVDITLELNWDLPKVWYSPRRPYIKGFATALVELHQAEQVHDAIMRELSELESKSRRTKARLVREMLKAT